MRWGNIILGALALALLEGIVTSRSSTANVGGFLASSGKAVAWFIDPTVPAFKNTSTPSTSQPAHPLTTQSAFPASNGVAPSTNQPSAPGPVLPGVPQVVV